ncbi:MAG: prolyl oligopeptidase family serine peptidase [Kiritimatiellae bacterium]|nr:prolyl oligopeptidase family serine peptidase [Kiritimatiellia bacterium]
MIPGFWKEIKAAVKPLEVDYGRRVKVASERPLKVSKPRSTVVKGVKYGEIYEVKCSVHEPLAFLRIDWKKEGAKKWASRAASVQVVGGRAVFRVPQGVDSFAVVYNQTRCAKKEVEFSALEVNKLEVLSDEEQALTAASDELYRYWHLITGSAKSVPVRLRIDPSISKTGNDTSTSVTEPKEGKTFITGSNARSVLYGVYDLLERRGGCGWFWDGDRIPKKAKIDLSGLNVREESKFAYRGVRYFAHRGLHRFQAEHWGLEDWKREIDWCLKKRLNLFMLRIGQDDLFQKAFPSECAYPDSSKPLPGQGRRYDNRSLFWPLEFRGQLRKEVMKYAFRRGMMAPSDFGTMTHWYSRTPQDFLDNKKPAFLPQAPGAYGEPSGRVWDIRNKKWMDAYWKITDADIREYGRPGLLHTIGIAERRVSTNRQENLAMKTRLTKAIFAEADKRYPNSAKLLAGWDLYCMKKPEEVKAFLKNIPEDVIIWDYEADATINTWFGEWDIVGKRPYAFGVFMAYEAGLDSRTDYAKIASRQKLIENDPMCKGYILWPESSHVDSVGIEWFARNSWRADKADVAPVVADYCERRYPQEAQTMKDLWLKTIPVSTNMQNTWRWNAFLPILREMGEGLVKVEERKRWPAPKPEGFFSDLPKVAKALKSLDWEKDEFLKRDMIDIARVWADRLAIDAENAMFTEYFKWLDGDKSAEERFAKLADIAYERLKALSSLIALHSDFSICDTYDKLVKIHPIANPGFSSVLVDNVANYYCTSHQAELAYHCYLPAFKHYTDTLKEKMARGDKEPIGIGIMEEFKDRVIGMSFAKLRLDVSRTRDDFNRAIDMILAAAAYRGGDAFSEECIRALSIAGFYSPDPKRDLLKDPVWRTRFRTFKSSADDTLQPFYWYDPGVSEKVPLVIALHSWGASVNWSTPATTTQPYCEKNGWAMLYPNFRGGNMRPEACGSDLAVNDILDLIKWAQNERAIDSERIYIIGGSGGGHFALLMAGRHPEVFAASVAFCPITDLARWHADSTLRKNNYAANIVAACGGEPSPTNKEYAARSPLTHLPAARQAGTPIYVATGIHDGHTGTVPVGHSIRAYNVLADEGDRISEETIAEIENTEAIPEAFRFTGCDPLYTEKNKIWLRKDSANVRLTIFEGGHSANYPAGLDFLSRQRLGKPADFSLPSAGASTIEAVTR